ncbi:unnamed protein product [Sphagnum troendelagicum]
MSTSIQEEGGSDLATWMEEDAESNAEEEDPIPTWMEEDLIPTCMQEDAESNADEEHPRAEEEPPRLELRGPLSVRLRLLSESLRRGITAVVRHMFTP